MFFGATVPFSFTRGLSHGEDCNDYVALPPIVMNGNNISNKTVIADLLSAYVRILHWAFESFILCF